MSRVIFLSSIGALFDEAAEPVKIEARDPRKAVEMSREVGSYLGNRYARPYGFRFDPQEPPWPPATYYIGGELRTYDEVVEEQPDSLRAQNMRAHDGMEIIWVRRDVGARVFGLRDFVVSEVDGMILERGDSQLHIAVRRRIRAAIRRHERESGQ